MLRHGVPRRRKSLITVLRLRRKDGRRKEDSRQQVSEWRRILGKEAAFLLLCLYSLGGRLWKRICKMFIESSAVCWAVLQLPCRLEELPENILLNLFHNQPTQTVLFFSFISPIRDFHSNKAARGRKGFSFDTHQRHQSIHLSHQCTGYLPTMGSLPESRQ